MFRLSHGKYSLPIFALMMGALAASDAYSGPDEITNRLMGEDVTLLDFGIFRLQMFLDGNAKLERSYVEFDWDNNKVMIKSFSFGSDGDLTSIKPKCDRWFDEIRASAGLDTATGQLSPFFSSSLFSSMFTHYGWERTVSGKTTGEIAKEIDAKFQLEYIAYTSETEAGQLTSITCSASLIEKGFSVKEDFVK